MEGRRLAAAGVSATDRQTEKSPSLFRASIKNLASFPGRAERQFIASKRTGSGPPQRSNSDSWR